jgi:hypothetical protein
MKGRTEIITICSSRHISKITGMAVLIFWCSMLLARRIVVWSLIMKQVHQQVESSMVDNLAHNLIT